MNSTSGNTTLILTEAKELQTAIVKRIEIESRGDLQEEKQLLSVILCSLAKVKTLKEPAIAANLYSEALIHVPRNPDTLLSLAKLYAQVRRFIRFINVNVFYYRLRCVTFYLQTLLNKPLCLLVHLGDR